jgi:hypothetical protein
MFLKCLWIGQKIEVRMIVEDYFNMLKLELSNNKYNKTEHRNLLLPHFDDRSKGAIEFKTNISAALINMGFLTLKAINHDLIIKKNYWKKRLLIM